MCKVFVYGTLMKDQPNHRLMQFHQYLGEATLQGYDLYCYGIIPYIKEGQGTVKGELYEVDDFAHLDRLESHPRLYKRTMVETSEGEAWVYVGNQIVMPRDPIVKSGDYRDLVLNL